MTSPTSGDPVTRGIPHLQRLVDDVLEQAGAGGAQVTINLRAFLETMLADTHPDRVSLPRVRTAEIHETQYPVGVTADGDQLFARYWPHVDSGNVTTELITGQPAEVMATVTIDAEGARVNGLALLAVAMHSHPAFTTPADPKEVTAP